MCAALPLVSQANSFLLLIPFTVLNALSFEQVPVVLSRSMSARKIGANCLGLCRGSSWEPVVSFCSVEDLYASTMGWMRVELQQRDAHPTEDHNGSMNLPTSVEERVNRINVGA